MRRDFGTTGSDRDDSAEEMRAPAPWWRSEIAFLRRVLIVAAVAALALLLWVIRDALLLAFAGVVIAVVLLSAAQPFETYLGFRRRWSLLLGGLVLFILLGVAGWVMGSTVRAQVAELGGQLPGAVAELERRTGLRLPVPHGTGGAGQQPASPGNPPRPGEASRPAAGGNLSDIGAAVGWASSIGFGIVEGVTAAVLAVIVGVFLAADPALYRRGLAKLLPRGRRPLLEEALDLCGRALRQWVLVTVIAMVTVGLLAGLGTWAIGLSAPLALGLFAGLLEFMSIIGPVGGAVPPLLLAAGQGSTTVLLTLLLFIVIQQLESNVIAPILAQRVIHVPPALLLLAVVAFGAAFGLPGVMLAPALTVVAFVLVKVLYVKDTLGERTELPGDE